jgi:hypothetical protein
LGPIDDGISGLSGVVLGFGAGAFISSVSFELVEKGTQEAGAVPVALGLAAGRLPSSPVIDTCSEMVVARAGLEPDCLSYWAPCWTCMPSPVWSVRASRPRSMGSPPGHCW